MRWTESDERRENGFSGRKEGTRMGHLEGKGDSVVGPEGRVDGRKAGQVT